MMVTRVTTLERVWEALLGNKRLTRALLKGEVGDPAMYRRSEITLQ